MGYAVTIYTHHKVTELVELGKFVLTTPRTLQYRGLLTYPDVSIVRCNTINLADNIPLSFEKEPHECVAEAIAYSKLRPNLKSVPLLDPDVTCFVDVSCYRDHECSLAGYVIVKQIGHDSFKTTKAESVYQTCSKGRIERFDKSLHFSIR